MNEIAQNLRCVLLRNGIEIWVDEERAKNVANALNESKYFILEGSLISPHEISGVLTPVHMEEYKRHKEGQWKCNKNTWHDRGQKCNCHLLRTITRDGEKVEQEFTVGSGWRDKY